MSLQLEVGKKYRRRDGEVREIVDEDEGFYSDDGYVYGPKGNFWAEGQESANDFIEEVSDEPEYVTWKGGDPVPDCVPDPFPASLEVLLPNRSWDRACNAKCRQSFFSLVTDGTYRVLAADCIKTPQPGEWWLEDDGDLCYLHGFTKNGDLVYEYRIGDKTYVSNAEPKCFVRHLPDCTGWDYEVPDEEPEPEPKTKTITLHKWLYRLPSGWVESGWREKPPFPSSLENHSIDTKEVEVPCE